MGERLAGESGQGGAQEVFNWDTGLRAGGGRLGWALQHHGQIPAQEPWGKGGANPGSVLTSVAMGTNRDVFALGSTPTSLEMT